MSKSTEAGMQEEGQVRLYVYRVPKKNHDAIILNQRQFADVFKKHGCYARSFQLTSTETSEGFTSMVAAVSANQEEEEVWIDLESYRDREHMNDVVSKINSDESALSLMKQYLSLLSPGSSPILAEFSRPPNG
jgi:uncharacterized protein YbaA (DUF1428 family)